MNIFRASVGRDIYSACSSLSFPGPRFIECPDKTTSFATLQWICLQSNRSPSEVGQTLGRLLVRDEPREEEVDIRKITAITNSKGELIGNLPQLVHTISEPSKWITDKTEAEQNEILHEAVVREFPTYDGRLAVFEEGWSGRLIGSNSGAARRFSLLRQRSWDGKTRLPVSITRINLDPVALATLTEEQWLFLAPKVAFDELDRRLARLKVEGLDRIAEVYSDAQARDQDRCYWTLSSVSRCARHYRDLRLGIEDARIPLFDLSRW